MVLDKIPNHGLDYTGGSELVQSSCHNDAHGNSDVDLE